MSEIIFFFYKNGYLYYISYKFFWLNNYIFNFLTVFLVVLDVELIFWWPAMLFNYKCFINAAEHYVWSLGTILLKKKICFVRLFNKIVMFSQANRDDRLRIFYVYLANRLKASRVCSSYRIMCDWVCVSWCIWNNNFSNLISQTTHQ